MISSRVHGIIDYLVAALLLIAPYLFGFADGGPAQLVPTILAAVIIVVSLTTRYELSVARVIPYPTHLVLDVLVGLVLLVSPWLFGFANQIWWPHVAVGIAAFVVVALSWGGRRTTIWRARSGIYTDYRALALPPPLGGKIAKLGRQALA